MIPEELRRLLVYVAPYRMALALAMLCMGLESAVSLAMPWLVGQLAGPLLQTTSGQTVSLVPLLVLLLSLCVTQALGSFGTFYLASRTAEHLVADLRAHLYDHLQSLPLGFYHQRPHGEILALLTRDAEIISWFISGPVLNILPAGLTLLGAMVVMIRIDAVLGLCAILAVPLGFACIKLVGYRLRTLSQQLAADYATAMAIAQEHLRLLPMIKAFTYEDLASARYRAQIRHIIDLTMRQLRMRAALGPLIQGLTAGGILLLLWFAGQKVVAGTLAPQAVISFLLYGLLLTRPLSALAAAYGQYQLARGATTRLLEALQVLPEPLESYAQATPASVLPRLRGEIAFCHVTFAYPGRPPLLQDFNLRIAPGETVALVGPNGAGKSTLGYLLLRLYTPQAGMITLDGQDIAAMPLRSLRRQIGVVFQQPLLSNGTIRDNLLYGNVEATSAELEAAARAARAHDFIMQLPEGYETRIGDNGIQLSGGQQQRVCLARALLKDPPIVLLDEATSMYDPAGEREMVQACREMFRTRTVLVITHHPTTLALADRTVRLAGVDGDAGSTAPLEHDVAPLR